MGMNTLPPPALQSATRSSAHHAIRLRHHIIWNDLPSTYPETIRCPQTSRHHEQTISSLNQQPVYINIGSETQAPELSRHNQIPSFLTTKSPNKPQPPITYPGVAQYTSSDLFQGIHTTLANLQFRDFEQQNSTFRSSCNTIILPSEPTAFMGPPFNHLTPIFQCIIKITIPEIRQLFRPSNSPIRCKASLGLGSIESTCCRLPFMSSIRMPIAQRTNSTKSVLQ